ncbi:hydroxyurea phosphotransferase [Streptomyces bungoensis]|uniref:Hydroxyurea phosphotransferase n=1 Tax=Streptomyces bungoensis TaxID=285568 RepID=A0A101T8G9_9ACTN|nr:aminoglycoside phosphotransferase family protein [Streptomyces bungoensis]KUN87597.1 hydroxyurea phosphotransferase [Streptomyces bungoensis]
MTASIVGPVIEVPGELAASQEKFNGAAGRAFVAGLPRRAEEFLRRWELRRDGPAMHGLCALVLPVRRAGGGRAVLKLQLPDEENAGEAAALGAWAGDGAVRLLEHDGPTRTLLLERLDERRALTGVPDARAAVEVLAVLLARLTSVPAPAGLRRLGDIAQRMLQRAPWALGRIPDVADRRLVADCAAAVREVAAEPGDRLLHWDLHYGNVLAAERAAWLAIDPKPLAGDPGFDLLPALADRHDPADTAWRFDALTAALGLDRERARAWTLGRVLQNSLWDIAEGRPPEPVRLAVGRALRA